MFCHGEHIRRPRLVRHFVHEAANNEQAKSRFGKCIEIRARHGVGIVAAPEVDEPNRNVSGTNIDLDFDVTRLAIAIAVNGGVVERFAESRDNLIVPFAVETERTGVHVRSPHQLAGRAHDADREIAVAQRARDAQVDHRRMIHCRAMLRVETP